MASYIKLVSNSISCNATANTFFGAKCVRVVNANTTPALVTYQSNTGANVASTVVLGGTEVFIIKRTDELLISNNTTGLFGSGVGF